MLRSLALLLLAAIMAALPGQSATAQQSGAPHPIPQEMIEFVKAQFVSVPAPTLVDAVSKATCRKSEFGEQTGIKYVGFELCDVGAACPDLLFPVWFDGKGGLGFGPDSAERLVAMFCSEAISDPERRQKLVDSVFQGG